MDANSLFQFFPDATTSGKERIVLGIRKKRKSRLFIAANTALKRNRLKIKH